MTRRRLSALLLIMLLTSLSACVSPFHDHAEDVKEVFSKDARSAHRKWDRYFLNFDWDDPYHEWHDPSFASGPMHRH